jgi:putative peptidoglycan lipid II flippase
VVGAIVGHRMLQRRLGALGFGRVGRTVAQVGVASVVGGAVAALVLAGTESALGTGHAGSLVALVLGSALGLAAMGAVAWRMRIPEIQDIARLVGAGGRR